MRFLLGYRWSILGLLVLLSAPAAAQEPGGEALPDRNTPGGKPQKPPPVAMEVQVGLKLGEEFYAREGQATPVRVVLDNNDKAVTGHLEVRNWRRRGVTRMPIDLPRRAHKEYTLYVPLARNLEHPEGASGEVLLFAGRKVLAQKLLKPKFPDSAVLVMSATGDDSGLQFLTEGKKYNFPGEQQSLYASHVAPRDLPRAWPGYRPADVVALNGRAWTEMDDEQRRALRMWVEQGGRAVLCSAGPTQWRDPEALALAGVIGRDPVSDPELRCVSPWAGQPYRAREGTILTVTGPLQPGAEATWKEEGRPLIVTRQAVAGRVVWLGFDPFTQSFREWDGSPRFWRRLLDWARHQEGTDPYHALGDVETARSAANSLPRLPAPPLAAIVAFGVIYAVIFGPLNIWMLRRLRRTVRSWLFVPALALGMTLIVLGVGQSWGNARTVLNSLSILNAADGGRTAREQSLIGLFSPTNRSFDLSLEDPAPEFRDITDFDPGERTTGDFPGWPNLQQDGTVTWDALALELFSTRLLHEKRPRDLGGPVEVKLNPDGSGTVHNGTNLALRGAYLQAPDRAAAPYCWLGDVAPGSLVTLQKGKWSGEIGGDLLEKAPDAQLLENRQFRGGVRQLWREARELLVAPAGRTDAWLVAECADYQGGLHVSEVPYNNRAALLLVRIPRTPD